MNDQLASQFRALGHEARIKILRYLNSHPGCVTGDLSEPLGLAPSTVSQHLKILREADLICGEIDGPRRCYCVNPDTLGQAVKGLQGLFPNGELDETNTRTRQC